MWIVEFFPEENFQKWPIYPSRTFSAVSRRRPQGSSSSSFDGERLMRFYLSLCFSLICEKKKNADYGELLKIKRHLMFTYPKSLFLMRYHIYYELKFSLGPPPLPQSVAK